ncbi:MAG: glucokinase [Epulopiscium sp. Nele67-Bin004]|nr:MAG: glucokinase [Epulopiscium sp. Nele67-Bin004]
MKIGVDLGGTTIKVGLVDDNYAIVQTAVGDTKRGRPAEEIIKDMADLCLEVMNKQGIDSVETIGIGCPGMASGGIIKRSSNLDFYDVDVRVLMNKYIDAQIFVENDANVAALGEVAAGAAKGKTNAVMVTLGTGVGGGIIANGKIFSGAFGGAGEIGHQIIKFDNGIDCGCGRTGCWEQYASATALIRQAEEALNKKNITAKDVFELAENGNTLAKDVLENYLQFVSMGITNMINILEPEIIIIGGGISAQKEVITEPIKKYVQQQMYGGLQLQTEIKTAELGNDAGIIGAALLKI